MRNDWSPPYFYSTSMTECFADGVTIDDGTLFDFLSIRNTTWLLPYSSECSALATCRISFSYLRHYCTGFLSKFVYGLPVSKSTLFLFGAVMQFKLLHTVIERL